MRSNSPGTSSSALVDGFIVFCIEGGSRLVDLTRERGLPFVALDFGFDDETIAASASTTWPARASPLGT